MKGPKLKLHGLEHSISRERKRHWKFRDPEAIFGLRGHDGSIPFFRFYPFLAAVFLILLVFLARLFSLTIVHGAQNRDLSDNNRIHLVESEAPRGKVFDRNGSLLAQSQLSFILTQNGKDTSITADQANELEKQGLAGENFKGDLGQIKQGVKRIYTLGEATAHAIGYTSTVSEADIQGNNGLSKINSVGRLGVEQAYDNFLQGKPGAKLIEVDALGKNVSILGAELPLAGRDIHLTLDSGLQKITYEALKKQVEKVGTKKGAVIIQNPQTGEVLALVSAPSFNPLDIGKAVGDGDQPFFNRAIQGVYPPGSVFKPVVAVAGLSSGKITPDTEIEDVGRFEVSGTTFSNWYFNQYGKKDGVIKVDRAIARSNDIFFYKVAEMVGISDLHKTAVKLGFGQVTGIDLPGEAFGLVPDEVWKKSTLGEDWYVGDSMHLGIGQGFLLATPIQINQMTSYVASGKLTKPYVVFRIDSGLGGGEINFKGDVKSENLVDSKFLDIVGLGMQEACTTGGTGVPFFNAPYKVGCKTGTAEKTLGDPHAWFTAYAPFDKPVVTVTVVVENGGEGSVVAGPVAREILDWWFKNRN
ncbi:MAG: Penicillin-binding protein 2 [Candidatus Curtissbacteria bacterium GW2011_GWA1_40_16]|uniref:Penicillin-binding protein 2 n=1 Tax=Candidatus Curtissbacteria bacterium GW2011_GWA1_40_16 TaxID=1618405 RepID=A0A0G0TVX2_9BACT|nr:MAG: Penicillin-binding protein 2 [Candidatus Curtissbacteria bacterium GW2011_GWA1_40_16]